MIGFIPSLGKGFKGCLHYNVFGEKGTKEENIIRGEFIYSQNLDSLLTENPINCPIDDMVAEFHEPLALGYSRVKNPVLHQSFSFPPGEKVNKEILVNICEEFSRWFGLAENQMVVYKHSDKPHEHIHIIANRVNIDGINTYHESNNYYETGKFCRYIENKFGLQKTKQMDSLKLDGKGHGSENKLHAQLRSQIDQLAVEIRTTDELRHALLKKGWKSYVGRGIAFVHKETGTTVKGSSLGKNYSLAGLEKLLQKSVVEPMEDIELRDKHAPERDHLRMKIARNTLQSSDLNKFAALMKGDGYEVHYRSYLNKKGEQKKSIAFSKSFSGKANTSKYVTGLELGISYGYQNIINNIGARLWSEVAPSPTRPVINEVRRRTDSVVTANEIVKINHLLSYLLINRNANMVEADAAKSVARVEAEIARNAAGYNNAFGPRGIEDLKMQGKKKRAAKSRKV